MKIIQELNKKDILDYISTPANRDNLWLRISSTDDYYFLLSVSEHFDIHELLVEDIANTKHQSKFEAYENYSLIILKRIHETGSDIDTSQFSIIFGKNFIITFEERREPRLTAYIEDIKDRNQSIEHTVYDLVDHTIDSYLAHAYEYLDKTEEIEDKIIIADTESYQLSNLFEFKQKMHQFKRVVRPARELTDSMLHPKAEITNAIALHHCRDLMEHASRAVSIAENIEETLNSLHSIILTQIQYKLNKTMTVLTAISVIFSPLMVITGIYGMNFSYMPELDYKYAYFVVIGFMAAVGFGLFAFFMRRKLI